MDLETIRKILVNVGCPEDRSSMMAAQLLKRANQRSVERSEPVEASLAHLLGLMAGGWNSPMKADR